MATADARLMTAAKTDLKCMGRELFDLITATYEYSENESMQQAAENGDVPGGSGARDCILRGSYRLTTHGGPPSAVASWLPKVSGKTNTAPCGGHARREL